MRILISILRFEPERTLGSEVYLSSFLESLEKVIESEQIAVVGSLKACEWGHKIAGSLTWMPQKLAGSTVKRMIFERANIESLARKWNADAVYFPFNIMPKINLPSALLLHDLVNEFYCKNFPLYRPVYYRYVRSLVRRSIKNANAVITISNAIASELKTLDLINEKKIYVAPLAVNRKINLQKKPELLHSQNKKFILQSGAQLPHKSHSTGVKAMVEIAKENPSVFERIQLVLTGGADKNKKLKNLIKKLNLENEVMLLGRLDDEELEWTMQNAELLIFPTLYEGFGLGVVDAQLRKKNIIASDLPVLREVSGNSAYFFEPENEKDLAGKIISILERKGNQSLEFINGGTKNINKWSWEDHSKKVLQIIRFAASK